ncbi:MAG TPA: hypothetical protein PLD20_11670 [Blastocatellia bacterium]|nr:hypothetical protein [Blastocatellia bacterium]HMV82130.1 hypothetical protein [Blastocatellia bacterium]HMX28288.1 hypothetical protein [Blastocatellia bacterium]HMY74884.1 hypothetical protein [Blastocatellia bacterium]HMZ18582.1 hypothetical protein [Blastocatellia bacterium]
MKKSLLALLIAGALAASLWPASAHPFNANPVRTKADNMPPASTTQISPEEVIKRFTEKESELREIWKEYSYQQETKLQVLGPANVVSGEFYQVSEFVFNDAGKRLERILKAPPSTLDQTGLRMSQEDRDALINLQPFALAKEDLPNYSVSYVGKEKVDDLHTLVFDVIPKVMSNQRELERMKKKEMDGKFFQGRIWVDEEDLQIVKTAGKTVPEFKQRFPKFETYRENIDGRYWFPTYTYGDDYLEFDRFRPHVRMVVKYKNYRRFSSDIKFLDAEEVKDEKKPDDKAKPNADGAKPADAKKEDAKKEDPTKKPTRPRP